jgi:site-specific DNA-methyltransferase (adenine-specific)
MIQLIHGDCLEEMKKIPDGSIDLVLTDPPYGIKISSNPFRQKHTKKEWDNFIPTKKYFDEIFRISKHQVIWGGNYFELPPCRGFFVWDKKQSEKFSSAMCEYAWSSRNAPAKIFRKHAASFPKFHPTTKPLDMMEWILEWFPDAQTICDPFMGSGTTGVACKNLNRNFIGIELDVDYFAIAKERIGVQ